MNELLTMSVREMAGRIKKGEISPVEVLEVHLERVEEVNPKINAVVVKRYDEARKEAKAAQKRLLKDKSDLPPLFGVPCTVKDTYAMKGLPWAAGVWARRNLIADEDATVVERLRRNGAIVMGKTNVPEAAMWCETYNHVYGRTNNPYDLSRGAGGSSGGEGAIVASAASPFGVGSDVGGSIRYPCAFNGIPGHKPTSRMVPGAFHWPPAPGPLADYISFGPIARTVGDLAYILPLIAGPDGKDESCLKHDMKSPDGVDTSKLKVFYYDYNGTAKTDGDVRRAVALAAGAISGRKIPVEYWRPEGVEKGLAMWQAGMSLNPEPFVKNLEGDAPINLMSEFLKILRRGSKITFWAWGAAFIEKPGKLLRSNNEKSLKLAGELQKRIEQKLGDDGVIICPVFSTPAPKHNRIWLDFLGIGYSGMYNILGFPSTIVPVYYREDGLPVSVQIVSGRWNDHLTLAAARLLEETLGGWKPKEKIG